MENQTSTSLIALLLVPVGLITGQELKPVALPTPQTSGGKPLMQVLKERKSIRDFGPESLSRQILSNLLWAAWGINRKDGRRTAPSASNHQEIDVYGIMADGSYVYDATANTLKPVAQTDLRKLAGTQAYVADAPVNLVYVNKEIAVLQYGNDCSLSRFGQDGELDLAFSDVKHGVCRFVWYYLFDLPGSTREERDRISKSGFATKREAEDAEAIRRTEEQRKRDLAKAGASIAAPLPKTLSMLLEQFFRQHVDEKLAPKTIERYHQQAGYIQAKSPATHSTALLS